MRKIAIFFLLPGCIIALAVAALKFCNNVYFMQSAGALDVDLKYMLYACGDCYPQWHLTKSSANKNQLGGFSERDMQVFVDGRPAEKKIAAIC
jgi:hypothetical protein